MKRVQTLFAEHRARIAAHAFFDWLRGNNLPLRDRFAFAPLMVDFTMGFADMNKWFLGYENPRNDLERAINQHTVEDRTHSRLFLENWDALGLDQQLGWSASQTLWWLYQSTETLPVRRFGWDILRLSVQHPDPLVRFALMEAIEICGDVFFGNTKKVASQLSRQTGIDYRYYGEYHHARETGHLHTDESPFFAAHLSDAQHAAAASVTDQIFSGFVAVLDHLLEYCQRSTKFGAQLLRDLQQQGDRELTVRQDLVKERSLAALMAQPLSRSQAPLLDYLSERKAQLSRHPFLNWFKSDTTGISNTDKLCRFSPLWAIDIAGYADFLHFGLSYVNPQTNSERALNAWVDTLTPHGTYYLQDWKMLGIDQRLGWTSGQTIAFYFLGEQSEVHRRNLARVTRYAFTNRSALQRFWLAVAFEAGGDPLFDALDPIVASAETQTGALNYWAERHTLPRSTHDGSPPFESMTTDISNQEQHCISEMIGALFDNFEQQFALSLAEAERATLLKTPAALPPSVPPAPPYSPQRVVDQLTAK
jgi:hypothetical protein